MCNLQTARSSGPIDKPPATRRRTPVYVTPEIVASFNAAELLGAAYGGNEGNGPNPDAGLGSEHSHV